MKDIFTAIGKELSIMSRYEYDPTRILITFGRLCTEFDRYGDCVTRVRIEVLPAESRLDRDLRLLKFPKIFLH